jgi:hypothetical protein
MPVPATRTTIEPATPERRFDQWRLVSSFIRPVAGKEDDPNADHEVVTVHRRCRYVLDEQGKPVLLPNGRPKVEDQPEKKDGSHRSVHVLASVEQRAATDATMRQLFADYQANALRIGKAAGDL